ncbi:integrase [Kineosporia sp. NBRC 101677]|nr:integrase [Kineosporia sp. NBRC 101677]
MFSTDKYEGQNVTTYRVRWKVGAKRWSKPFRRAAQAESFRSQLVSASRVGEAFDVATGLPVSLAPEVVSPTTWYDFCCEYVDMKWASISGKYRKGVAEALVSATPPMLTTYPNDPSEARALRSALQNWGFNKLRRDSAAQPEEVTTLLRWVSQHSRPLADIEDRAVLRDVLDGCATLLTGQRAAGRTAQRKRVVVHNALAYALEKGYVTSNPVRGLKSSAPRVSTGVDRRTVPNPTQARNLIRALRTIQRSGPRLEAFFAVMYYSALRPEEVVNLRLSNLELPFEGWGWITIDQAAPDTGTAWSESGRQRELRELKHRARGDARRVPCPPELTALLHRHLSVWGANDSGRLFRGVNGDQVATVTYLRVWARARAYALTPDQAATALAKRPYDLRHAAVSTWLNGGVAPTQVAVWAGHSVDVLLKIYAECLDGQEAIALARIDAALEHGEP